MTDERFQAKFAEYVELHAIAKAKIEKFEAAQAAAEVARSEARKARSAVSEAASQLLGTIGYNDLPPLIVL